MISSSVFNIAKNSADALFSATGHRIVPISSSIVGAMMESSYTTAATEEGQAVDAGELIEQMTMDTAQSSSMHSFNKGVFADELIPKVQSHIHFIQNEVRPRFVQLQEQLHEFIEEHTKNGAASMFDVQAVVEPAMMGEDSFRGLIDRFADENVNEAETLTTLPAMGYNDLLSVMQLSNDSIDASAKAWLQSKGEEWLSCVYSCFFSRNNQPIPECHENTAMAKGMDALYGLPMAQRMDVGTAVFLIARGLLDTPPEADVGMTLNQWRDVMDRYSRVAANAVMSAWDQYESTRSEDTLIIGITNNGYGAIVYEPTLNKFLEEGGCIELIFGAIVSNRQLSYTRSEIISNSQDYKKIWENFEATAEQTIRARVQNGVRSFVVSTYINGLREQSALEAEYYAENAIDPQSTVEIVDNYLRDLSRSDILNAEKVALEVIAGIRYSYTPAKQFLTDMLDMHASGCIEVSEAALVAAVNYVADYLSTQVGLTAR